MSLLTGYLLRDKTSFLVILENRIFLQIKSKNKK